MPQVKQTSQTPRQGQHTRAEIQKTHRDSIARDDLDKNYSGDENKGPAANPKPSKKQNEILDG